MSWSGYLKAMERAHELAEFIRQTPATNQSYGAMCQAAMMWATIAMAEGAEPRMPYPTAYLDYEEAGRAETVSERPPFERFTSDAGVVGVRCSDCRHFRDNHGAAGCRECVCQQGADDVTVADCD